MEKPIRVAQIIGKLNAAGVEAVINNYYKNINREKYQFDFFIDADSNCSPPTKLMEMGARYYTIPPYQNLPMYLYTLVRYFKSNQYQIVHANMNTLSVFPLFAAWIAGVPVRINHNHSTAGKGETKKNILKYLLRPFAKIFATDFCACSKYAGEWLFGKRAVAKGKVTIFNNAIDCKKFRFNNTVRQEVRQELGVQDRFVIGHVGRFCYQKNHQFLIDIFEAVHKKDPGAVFLLIGQGELEEQIRQKTAAKGLSSCVIFAGVTTDVWRYYQAMDCFVLPSRYEGLPVVGVEAQTAGLPCVFSEDVSREAEITQNVKFLRLTDPVETWANEIIETKTFEREDTLPEIQAAGFDIEKKAGELDDFYGECLLRNNPSVPETT